MRNVVESIARALRGQVNWHRVGMLLGLTITAIAIYVLYHLLRDITPGEVLEAIRRTDPFDIVLAVLFVAAGYMTLTMYDYFALRSIGRGRVPYRVAAMAGFCSYSIGHNVGFSVFSGGTVRYRIYSTAAKLPAVDVAKICFIAGLTFWLGNVAVLGLGFLLAPEAASAVTHLPPALSRAIGIALLACLAAYIIWVNMKPRSFGQGSWTVRLPGGNLTLLQILIGVVDLACCAAAMYVLMPHAPHIDFLPLAVIFVTATLLGFASHAPGGLGVFDSAMLIALYQFNTEELVGALLLFRLLYYVTPFAISLAIMGAREFTMGNRAKPETANDVGQRTAKTVPKAKPAAPAARRDRPAKRSPRRRSPTAAG